MFNLVTNFERSRLQFRYYYGIRPDGLRTIMKKLVTVIGLLAII